MDGIKSWSDIARQLGFDPRGTNIAARIKGWMTYHHIHSFFDYLLGTPNDFFLHADVGPEPTPPTRKERPPSESKEESSHKRR
ncbi:hypothetical protein HDV00_006821 [Rhizophlyctis rosea]|nr:hypothetical protein HDV00_006821 [Rhizophlyctis rosea]